MPWVPSQSLLANPGRLDAYRSGGSISVQLRLTNAGSLTIASSISTALAAEISGNGYAAMTLSVSSFTYDSGQTRQELLYSDATLTASGGAIQYDIPILVSNSAANLDWLFLPSSSQTIADGASRTFRVQLNFGPGSANVDAA